MPTELVACVWVLHALLMLTTASNPAPIGMTCVHVCVCLCFRDTRTGKTLAVVVAIDKTDDLAKAGFLGEPDFTPSDRQAMCNLH